MSVYMLMFCFFSSVKYLFVSCPLFYILDVSAFSLCPLLYIIYLYSHMNCFLLLCVNLKIASYFANEMSLFGNSRRIAIWDMKTTASHSKSRETKGRAAFVRY